MHTTQLLLCTLLAVPAVAACDSSAPEDSPDASVEPQLGIATVQMGEEDRGRAIVSNGADGRFIASALVDSAGRAEIASEIGGTVSVVSFENVITIVIVEENPVIH